MDGKQERAWEFALEYKQTEPHMHSYMARMADTLLLAQASGCLHVDVTIATGYAFVAGEVVTESIVIAGRAGNCLRSVIA